MKKWLLFSIVLMSASHLLAQSRKDSVTTQEAYNRNGLDRTGNRNVIAIGYQIGGYTLIGFDYEVRMHDYLGVHFGAGAFGYTAGIKIHTNPKKNSPFFNLNYKDGGFGLVDVAGVEFGGRWVFSKKSDFGLHGQIGIVKILSINKEFEDRLFKDNGAPPPPYTLSLGIGFSW